MHQAHEKFTTPFTATSKAISLFHLTEGECIDAVRQNPHMIVNMLLANRSPRVLLAALQTDKNISELLCPADILQQDAQLVRDFLIENDCSLRESTQDALDATEGTLLEDTAYARERN